MIINSENLALKIVEVLEDKKATDIDVLNITNVSVLADYFIICTGNSTLQVKAIADAVEEKLIEFGYQPKHKEGYTSANWILLDYGEIIVHIFHHESRSFYNLERLWSDAQHLDIHELCRRVNNEGEEK